MYILRLFERSYSKTPKQYLGFHMTANHNKSYDIDYPYSNSCDLHVNFMSSDWPKEIKEFGSFCHFLLQYACTLLVMNLTDRLATYILQKLTIITDSLSSYLTVHEENLELPNISNDKVTAPFDLKTINRVRFL